ncbi:hypothetical protein BH23VER1_BH23VER1_30990 [soil metagenome]
MRRRHFLAAGGLAALPSLVRAGDSSSSGTAAAPGEERIDIHQHVNYAGRTEAALLRHQEAMGITMTILLPSGTPLLRSSTHVGRSNGLAARIFGTAAAARTAAAHPDRFVFFANEIPDIPGARQRIAEWLDMGACGIGEQKFNLPCDAEPMQDLYRLARDYGVPILLHFQHGTYNLGFERFHTMLEKFPEVNFIAHAQTWWGHIDRDHQPASLYPKSPVTPGGLSDRWLSDYPNLFGDLSAGSGLNSLTRDPANAAAFLHRHQDKLLLGTDCSDAVGTGDACTGASTIALLHHHLPAPARTKILSSNARRIIPFH